MEENKNFFTEYHTPHRLNGYDNTIMKQKAYMELDDSTVKIGYQIEEKENVLKNLREKIEVASRVENLQNVLDLKMQEKQLENEIKELKEQITDKNTLPKITSAFSNRKKTSKTPVLRQFRRFFYKNVLAKVSKKFNEVVAISDSLERLTNINKNVDDLIDMKVPYGEMSENYERLTAYLCHANRIHAEINKNIRKIS